MELDGAGAETICRFKGACQAGVPLCLESGASLRGTMRVGKYYDVSQCIARVEKSRIVKRGRTRCERELRQWSEILEDCSQDRIWPGTAVGDGPHWKIRKPFFTLACLLHVDAYRILLSWELYANLLLIDVQGLASRCQFGTI